MKNWVLVVSSAWLFTATAACAHSLDHELTAAKAMLAAHDLVRAEAAFRAIARARTFSTLPAVEQRHVLEDLINTSAKLRLRPDTAMALATLVQRWPESIADLDDHFTLQFLAESRDLSHEPRLLLLQALYDARWRLKWNIEPSAAWRDLALLLLEKHELSQAVEVSSHVSDIYVLIAMRSDRRFDSLTAAAPDLFDISAAARRELRGLQLLEENSPQSLELQSRTIETLGFLLHYGAMLAAADDVASEVTGTNYPDKLYLDYDEQYQWILNDRAAALERAGRWDEAVDVLTSANQLVGADAAQALNLASLDCDLRRPQDARAALREIASDTNAFGAMQIELVKLDASMQLGDSKQATQSLRYLSLRRGDSIIAYQEALLLANQQDAAARLLISRLLNGDQRQDALESIQTYIAPPGTPRRIELDSRWRDLIARPAVQSAVDKVGRISAFNLEPPEIFD